MGGLARRATVLRDYRSANPGKAMMLVETGNELKQTDDLDDPINRYVVSALEQLGVNAVNTTPGDLRRLNEIAIRGLLPKDLKIQFVCSTLEPAPANRFQVNPYAIQTLHAKAENQDVRIGVIAVSQPGVGISELGKTISVDEALKKYISLVKSQADLVVVLTRMKGDEAVELAARFPAIDVIVNGTPTGEGRELPKTGNTVIVESAHEGTAVGVLNLEWDAKGRITKSSNEIVPLPPNVPEMPSMAQLIEQAQKSYAAYKETQALKSPPLVVPRIYAGSQECRECHQKAYKAWEKSRHAHAMETLKKGGNHFNEDCLNCHVTGGGEDRGFVDVIRTPQLANVQCEACHNTALDHSRNPREVHPGIGMFQQMKSKVQPKRCLRCHTPERSPRFDFNSYWKRIEH